MPTGLWAFGRSAPPPGAQGGVGAEGPLGPAESFIRADLPADLRVAFLSTTSAPPGATVVAGVGGSPSANIVINNPRPVPLSAPVDVEKAFAGVEAAGGRDARASIGGWIANVKA